MDQSAKVQLVEVESISRGWKRFHIAGLVSAAFFGIVSGISLSTLYDDIEPLCGSASLSTSSEPRPNGRFTIMNGSYIYLIVTPSDGSEGACSFSEYTFISSFIFACIWMVFFLMCGAGGKSYNGLPQPWRIVPPATFFSVMFFLISLGAGGQTSYSFRSFCKTFDIEMGEIVNNNNSRSECQDLNLFQPSAGQNILHIETIMKIAEITGWFCITSWGFTAGLCVARLLVGPDFRPLLKATDVVVSGRNNKEDGYKKFINSSSSSVASSNSLESSCVIIETSKADVHVSSVTENDVCEQEVSPGDVPSDNNTRMADSDKCKKHVRLDPDVQIIR